MSAEELEQLEEQKRRSMLQVLFKTARLANEIAIQRLRIAVGDERIRLAHTSIFPHVPFDGIRLTKLAEKLGVTKQATQQLVDELVTMEMFERVPDPGDGRAKLIRWSERGREGIGFGLGVLGSLEEEIAEVVGRDELAACHETLLAALSYLETSS